MAEVVHLLELLVYAAKCGGLTHAQPAHSLFANPQCIMRQVRCGTTLVPTRNRR